MPTTEPRAGAVADDELDRDLAGLDHLEMPVVRPPSRAVRWWAVVWPKLAALTVVVMVWQVLAWRDGGAADGFPGPREVMVRLGEDLGTSGLWRDVGATLRRALIGFGLGVVGGGIVGLAVARLHVLRVALGSMITGLQTMPSIAWFPLAILLFEPSERAVYVVVVLGAGPSIANGIISGIDGVPPAMHRVGRTLGAGGFTRYSDIILPAAMPSIVAGLKQGWAFSWRSLLAGELLLTLSGAPSIGSRLQAAREASDSVGLIATLLVVFVIGVLVDAACFSRLERSLRRRRGLLAG